MKIKLKPHYLYSVKTYNRVELIKGLEIVKRKDIEAIYLFNAYHNVEKIKLYV